MGPRYVAEFRLRRFDYAGDREIEVQVAAAVGEFQVGQREEMEHGPAAEALERMIINARAAVKVSGA